MNSEQGAPQLVKTSLRASHPEIEALNRLTARINEGLLLDDILDRVYVEFREFIPYDRIGLALIEEEGDIVRARWARTEAADVRLVKGYAARLEGSSLQVIRETGQPRILTTSRSTSRRSPGRTRRPSSSPRGSVRPSPAP
jgi:hypothetical protein